MRGCGAQAGAADHSRPTRRVSRAGSCNMQVNAPLPERIATISYVILIDREGSCTVPARVGADSFDQS
ncbi:hypothetical protein BD414DRAFT_486573 [Trametes punicea]|nr:hypothetical protein BD414DRAFT_486573 [Trametes punicea]